MTADLVQRLSTCSAEERRAAAMELAQTGTDEAVRGLIGIVEAGNHTPEIWRRKPWYSLHKECVQPERWEYGLSDQLTAIEILGETRNISALEYLKTLYTPSARPIDAVGLGTYIDLQAPAGNASYRYTHARGMLKAELDYGIFLGQDNLLENEAHRTIQAAIQKLETALQNTPSTQ